MRVRASVRTPVASVRRTPCITASVRPWRLGTASVTAATFAVLFACGGPLRQDELDCEEAVSVLEGCCAGFRGSALQCQYTSDCNGTTYPAITVDASACIRGESCSELVSTGVCQRAQQARSYTTGTVSSHGPSAPSAVCP